MVKTSRFIVWLNFHCLECLDRLFQQESCIQCCRIEPKSATVQTLTAEEISETEDPHKSRKILVSLSSQFLWIYSTEFQMHNSNNKNREQMTLQFVWRFIFFCAISNQYENSLWHLTLQDAPKEAKQILFEGVSILKTQYCQFLLENYRIGVQLKKTTVILCNKLKVQWTTFKVFKFTYLLRVSSQYSAEEHQEIDRAWREQIEQVGT